MKGLYQRGDVWWFRYSLDGKQQRESLGTTDEAEAIELARQIKENPSRSAVDEWHRELDAYFTERVKARKMSKNTADARRKVLERFAHDFEISTPAQVTSSIAKRYYKDLQGRIEEVTAQTYVRWLQTFFEYLTEKRKIRRNPVEVEMDEVRKSPRKKFCSTEQVRKLIDNCEDLQLRYVLYCGFHCGLRTEEIIQSRPEWFDLDNGLLHVQRSDTWEPKDRDDRTIPMTKEFVAFVRDTYKLRSPFMIAPHKKEGGKWRYRYDFRRPYSDYMKGQGMPPWVDRHCMRRTFASLKVSAGVSLYKVAVWLGDMERVVQDHYGYLLPKDSDIERGL